MNDSPEKDTLQPGTEPTPDTATPTQAPAEAAAPVATPDAPVADAPAPEASAPAEAPGEVPVFAPAQETAPVASPPPAEQRTAGNTKMVGPMVAVFAVLAVVAIVAAAALGGLFGGSPEKVVTAALAATVKEQEATLAAQIKEVPMLAHLTETTVDPSHDTAVLTLQSIEGVPNANLISALLANSGLRYETRYDPAASAMDFNGALFFNGNDFADLSLYLSPELVAGGVPSFSSRLLSMAPKTLADDLKQSFLYDPETMDDETLAAYQDVVNGYVGYMQALSRLSQDPASFVGGMEALGKQAVANATYEKGDKVDGLTTYTVTIPGADVKQAVLDYYRFLYTESEFGQAMREMMESALRLSQLQQKQYNQQMADLGYPVDDTEAATYEDFIDELMTELETSCPEMPTTAVLKIDRKKIIRTATIEATPATPATGEEAMRLDGFSFDFTNDADGDSITFRMPMISMGEPMDIRMAMSDSLSNGVYSMLFQMDMAYPDMGMTVEVPVSMTLDKDGNLAIDGTMNMGGQGTLSLLCNGVMSQENGVVTTSLPGSRAGFSMPGVAEATLGFDLVATSAKLEGGVPQPEATLIFSMSEQELEALVEEYSAGAQRMLATLGLA